MLAHLRHESTDERMTAPIDGSMVKESEKCGLEGRFNIRQPEKWTEPTDERARGWFFFCRLPSLEVGMGKKWGSDLVKFAATAAGIHCELADN